MEKKLINKEIRKVSNSSFLLILLFVVIVKALAYGLKFAVEGLSNIGIYVSNDIYYFIGYALQFVVAIPLILLIFYKTRGKKTGLRLKTSFQKPKKSLWWIIKWSVISMSAAYITSFFSNIIFTIIQAVFNLKLHPVNIVVGDSPLSIITVILATMVYAPIFEELLCRATIYRNNEILGQWFAIVISGLLFGLLHMNYTQIPFAMVVGGFFAFMYAKTRSIIPAIIVHFAINSLATIMQLCYSAIGITTSNVNTLSNAEMTKMMMKNIPAMMIIFALIMVILSVIIAGIVFFIIEVAKNRKQLKLMKGIYPVSAGKKIAVYFTSPIALVTIAVMLFITVKNALGL